MGRFSPASGLILLGTVLTVSGALQDLCESPDLEELVPQYRAASSVRSDCAIAGGSVNAGLSMCDAKLLAPWCPVSAADSWYSVNFGVQVVVTHYEMSGHYYGGAWGWVKQFDIEASDNFQYKTVVSGAQGPSSQQCTGASGAAVTPFQATQVRLTNMVTGWATPSVKVKFFGCVVKPLSIGQIDYSFPAGQYLRNADLKWTLNCPTSAMVDVTFSKMHVETGYDAVTVAGGTRYSGTALPAAITVPSGSVVHFTSDGSVEYTGFTLNYQCSSTAESFAVTLDTVHCRQENDGGGSAEEVFGNLYVQGPWTEYPFNLLEDAAVSINEGTSHAVGKTVAYGSVSYSQVVTIGGHLYEEDTGGDDDLGAQASSKTVLDWIAAGSASLTFTNGGTIIDAHFTISAKKRRYMEVVQVQCVSPSKGTDVWTQAGLTLAMAGVVVAKELVGAIPAGLNIVTFPVKVGFALYSNRVLVFEAPAMFLNFMAKSYPGADDLIVKINNNKVWPSAEYQSISSQQYRSVGQKVVLDAGKHVSLFEYDSASDDDFLGSLYIPSNTELGYHQIALVNVDEESLYNVFISITEE